MKRLLARGKKVLHYYLLHGEVPHHNMYFPEVLNTVNNEPEEYGAKYTHIEGLYFIVKPDRVLCGFIARSLQRGEMDSRAPLPAARFLVDGSISINYEYSQIIL